MRRLERVRYMLLRKNWQIVPKKGTSTVRASGIFHANSLFLPPLQTLSKTHLFERVNKIRNRCCSMQGRDNMFQNLTNSQVDSLMVYGLLSLAFNLNFQPGVFEVQKNIFELFLNQTYTQFQEKKNMIPKFWD